MNGITLSEKKLQRLAVKVHQEAKVTDSKLDDIEAWIEDEAKRVDHLHPKDAKNNCDQVILCTLPWLVGSNPTYKVGKN